MYVARRESHQIAVHAGQGQTSELISLVRALARREGISTAEILLACMDDFQQTAAHIAAKAGQTRSIEALAELLSSRDNRTAYFDTANRFSGDRPVHTAMRHGYFAVMEALVANGADPTAKNRFGDTVVDYLGDYEPEDVQRVVDEYNARVKPGMQTRVSIDTKA